MNLFTGKVPRPATGDGKEIRPWMACKQAAKVPRWGVFLANVRAMSRDRGLPTYLSMPAQRNEGRTKAGVHETQTDPTENNSKGCHYSN